MTEFVKTIHDRTFGILRSTNLEYFVAIISASYVANITGFWATFLQLL